MQRDAGIVFHPIKQLAQRRFVGRKRWQGGIYCQFVDDLIRAKYLAGDSQQLVFGRLAGNLPFQHELSTLDAGLPVAQGRGRRCNHTAGYGRCGRNGCRLRSRSIAVAHFEHQHRQRANGRQINPFAPAGRGGFVQRHSRSRCCCHGTPSGLGRALFGRFRSCINCRSLRRLCGRHGHFRRFRHGVRCDDRQAACGQYLPAFFFLGAFHAHDQGHRQTHGFGCGHNAFGDGVAAHDAAKNIDQNGFHVPVLEHDLERLGHLLGRGTAAYVEKVGGLAAVQLDGVHGRHGQPRTIDHAADVAAQTDVGQAEFGCLQLGRIFLIQIAIRHDFGVAEQRIAVEVEFGIQRRDGALAVAVERIDFHQRGVRLHVASVELAAHVDKLRPRIWRHAHALRQLFALRLGQALLPVDKNLGNFLGLRARHFFDVHAARLRGNQRHFLRQTVGNARQVVLLLNIRAFFNIQAAYFLAPGPGLRGHQLHAQHLARKLLHLVDRARHFHAAALATPTGMDLGLDDPHRPTEFLRGLYGLLNGKGRNPARHRYAEFAQNILTLVLMNFHGIGSPTGTKTGVWHQATPAMHHTCTPCCSQLLMESVKK